MKIVLALAPALWCDTAALSSGYWYSEAPVSTTPSRVLAAIRAAPWRGAFEPAREIAPDAELAVVQGAVPAELVGTLYKNGAGRVRLDGARGADDAPRYGHWFDGDGFVTKLSLNGSAAPPRFAARYVETPRRRAQAAAAPGAGFATRGAWTQRGDGSVRENCLRIPTNPANTNAMLVGHGRARALLALCEGGPPVALDPRTLETRTSPPPWWPFSPPGSPRAPLGELRSFLAAHPKRDARARRSFGCGLQLGPSWPPRLNVVEFDDASGAVLRQRALAMPEFAFVHDLALTRAFVVVVLSPWRVPAAGFARAILGAAPLAREFAWGGGGRDAEPTRVLVVERATLELVATATLPPCAIAPEPGAPEGSAGVASPSVYHVINAHDLAPAGAGERRFALDLAVLRGGDRPALERAFGDVYAANFHGALQCAPWRYEIAVGEGDDASVVAARALVPPPRAVAGNTGDDEAKRALPMELPDIAPSFVGRRARCAYVNALAGSSAGPSFLNAIQKVDLSGRAERWPVARFPGCYAGSPIFVPRRAAADGGAVGGKDGEEDEGEEDDGFVLTYVYDPRTHTSDVVVLDARAIDEPPLATIRLPCHVPPSFHGTWVAGETFL